MGILTIIFYFIFSDTIDRDSAEIYGKIGAELEKKGTPLTEPDMRIASIALCHKLVLVTGNVKHFLKIPGLIIENWLET